MNADALDERFELTDVEQARLDYFREYCFHAGETCSHCYTKIRSIGPEIARSAESQTYHIKAWYERTEQGSQEYAPGDTNKRYGQCYCLECGNDTSAHHANLSLEQLGDIAVSLYEYVSKHTPIELDHERFSRELVDLKRDPHKQGYETEMLAVAFARSVVSAPADQAHGDSDTTSEPSGGFTSTAHTSTSKDRRETPKAAGD